MGIAELRRRRADRRALRAEHSRGEGWLDYRRRRWASMRAMRKERRALGRGWRNVEPDKGWAETYGSGGFFTDRPSSRR